MTGFRQDAWANTHRITVEEEKSETERGSYMHPQEVGPSEEKSIEWARHPEQMKQMKTKREQCQEASTP